MKTRKSIKETESTCLLGEDLAVIPCAAEEEVAIVVCMVPSGDHAMDM
jgi:hypothetical protein